jgi:hypothetical protein
MGYWLDVKGLAVKFLAETRDVSLLHNIQTGSVAQPASHMMKARASCPGGKVARA